MSPTLLLVKKKAIVGQTLFEPNRIRKKNNGTRSYSNFIIHIQADRCGGSKGRLSFDTLQWNVWIRHVRPYTVLLTNEQVKTNYKKAGSKEQFFMRALIKKITSSQFYCRSCSILFKRNRSTHPMQCSIRMQMSKWLDWKACCNLPWYILAAICCLISKNFTR